MLAFLINHKLLYLNITLSPMIQFDLRRELLVFKLGKLLLNKTIIIVGNIAIKIEFQNGNK